MRPVVSIYIHLHSTLQLRRAASSIHLMIFTLGIHLISEYHHLRATVDMRQW